MNKRYLRSRPFAAFLFLAVVFFIGYKTFFAGTDTDKILAQCDTRLDPAVPGFDAERGKFVSFVSEYEFKPIKTYSHSNCSGSLCQRYELSVFDTGQGLCADISVDGHMESQRVRAFFDVGGDKTDVLFAAYRSGHSGFQYDSRELLFSLVPVDEKSYSPIWGSKMKWDGKPSESLFVQAKTADIPEPVPISRNCPGNLNQFDERYSPRLSSFLDAVKLFLGKNNQDFFARTARYPFTSGTKIVARDEKEFKDNFDQIFTPEVREAILKETPECLILRDGYVNIGDGALWVRLLDRTNGDFDLHEFVAADTDVTPK